VYFFGGSAAWGTGAPDWGTIPAYLQQQIGALLPPERALCVMNFAQWGYVSTQEVIALTQRLQQGDVPDIAVFYNGYNDAFAAYQSGQAGGHQNMSIFTQPLEDNSLMSRVIVELQRTSTYQVLQGLLQPEQVVSSINPVLDGVDLDALTRDVVRIYRANYALVDTLAARYGFDFVFALQPSLYDTDKALIPVEQFALDTADDRMVMLLRGVYAGLRTQQTGMPHFYDVSALLDDFEGFLWIDEVHIILEGNQVMAARITERIAPQILERLTLSTTD
jgi:lysophospholipase L1-like esterase